MHSFLLYLLFFLLMLFVVVATGEWSSNHHLLHQQQYSHPIPSRKWIRVLWHTVEEEVEQLKGNNDKLESQIKTLTTSVEG
jgi:cell division protein FtsB